MKLLRAHQHIMSHTRTCNMRSLALSTHADICVCIRCSTATGMRDRRCSFTAASPTWWAACQHIRRNISTDTPRLHYLNDKKWSMCVSKNRLVALCVDRVFSSQKQTPCVHVNVSCCLWQRKVSPTSLMSRKSESLKSWRFLRSRSRSTRSKKLWRMNTKSCFCCTRAKPSLFMR